MDGRYFADEVFEELDDAFWLVPLLVELLFLGEKMKYISAQIPPIIKVASPGAPRNADANPVTTKMIKPINNFFILWMVG